MDTFVRVADHISLDQVLETIQMTAGALQLQKWLVIYNAIVDPRPLSKIAIHTGLSEATVRRTIAEYNLLGPLALKGVCVRITDTSHNKRCGDMTIM